nr:MAG TPA: hypothetical protein [Caudoviricetes sp.]
MAQEAPVKFSTQKEKAHRGTRPGRLFRVWQIKTLHLLRRKDRAFWNELNLNVQLYLYKWLPDRIFRK